MEQEPLCRIPQNPRVLLRNLTNTVTLMSWRDNFRDALVVVSDYFGCFTKICRTQAGLVPSIDPTCSRWLTVPSHGKLKLLNSRCEQIRLREVDKFVLQPSSRNLFRGSLWADLSFFLWAQRRDFCWPEEQALFFAFFRRAEASARRSSPSAPLASRVTHAPWSPRACLCSPKKRKKITPVLQAKTSVRRQV